MSKCPTRKRPGLVKSILCKDNDLLCPEDVLRTFVADLRLLLAGSAG